MNGQVHCLPLMIISDWLSSGSVLSVSARFHVRLLSLRVVTVRHTKAGILDQQHGFLRMSSHFAEDHGANIGIFVEVCAGGPGASQDRLMKGLKSFHKQGLNHSAAELK